VGPALSSYSILFKLVKLLPLFKTVLHDVRKLSLKVIKGCVQGPLRSERLEFKLQDSSPDFLPLAPG
jgi:hypothetical protein